MTGALIVRQVVQPGLPYTDYREPLRYDFVWACAYCTITELEAQGISFEVDHYVPQAAGGTDSYDNLYYSCDRCNQLKKSWTSNGTHPAGLYIIRIDQEDSRQHLELDPADLRCLQARTSTGEYNIEMLDLNRWSLTEIRALRARLRRSHELIAHGVRALSRVRLDELPAQTRTALVRHKLLMNRNVRNIRSSTEKLLQALCQSSLLDPDLTRKERKRRRLRYREQLPPVDFYAVRPRATKRKTKNRTTA